MPKPRELEIHLRQADPESYRRVLADIKMKEIRNLIIDTKPEHMHHFLRMVCKIFLFVYFVKINKHYFFFYYYFSLTINNTLMINFY